MSIVYLNPKSNGGVSGTVSFTAMSTGQTAVSVDLKGLLPASAHAIHIHEKGNLSKGCMGTGGHWNPLKTTHGSHLYPDRPRHMGDLVNNIYPDASGNVSTKFNVSFSPMDIIGRAVVVHSLADDLGLQGLFETNHSFTFYEEMTQQRLETLSKQRKYPVGSVKQMSDKLAAESLKTGNAGGRMACGVVGIA